MTENKFPQNVNKSEWSLFYLDSSDSSSSHGRGLVICPSVLLKVFFTLEDLVTERANDDLEFVICSFALLEGVSKVEVLVTESASDGSEYKVCSQCPPLPPTDLGQIR